jgi:hypothetical protein
MDKSARIQWAEFLESIPICFGLLSSSVSLKKEAIFLT